MREVICDNEPKYSEAQMDGALDAMKVLSLRVQYLEAELARVVAEKEDA